MSKDREPVDGEDRPTSSADARERMGAEIQTRARPLVFHLVVLCLALVLPILVLAGLLAWYYANSERNSIQEQALGEGRNAIAAVDRELAGLMAATQVLSLSRLLRNGDLDEFDSQARDVFNTLGVNVVLRDTSGQQLVNTRRPKGAALPVNVEESDQFVIESKQPMVSNLFIGAVAGTPLFIVSVPVLREEEVSYLLNLSLPPERIREVVLERPIPEGWTVTVADGHGKVVASTDPDQDVAGNPMPQALMERVEGSDGAVEQLVEGMDGPVLVTLGRSHLSQWIAVVTLPIDLLAEPLRRSFTGLAGIAVLVVLLAAGLAVLFSRRIERPVATLAGEAARLGRGLEARPVATRVREVNELGAVLAEASVMRRTAETALTVSELRLRELQHELMHASRLSAMGEMAAALAHELNQPLGAATNYVNAAQIVLNSEATDSVRRARSGLQKAVEQMLRAGAILRRLRDFVARGEADKRILDARRLVDDAVALAIVGVRDPALRVRIDFPPALPPILADAIQIQQVVFNLVRNALEATEGRQPREIGVTAREVGDAELEISVVDTGPGLPADREVLFRPFGSTKRTGLGVGLSISRTIIEGHGGRLWAEPVDGGGAAFRFTVPFAQHLEVSDD